MSLWQKEILYFQHDDTETVFGIPENNISAITLNDCLWDNSLANDMDSEEEYDDSEEDI